MLFIFFAQVSICSVRNITLVTEPKTETNFNIVGFDGDHRIWTTYSDYGYTTTLRVDSNEIHPTYLTPTTLNGITISTTLLHLDSNYIKIVFTLTNNNNIDKLASVAVDSDVMIDTDDHATIKVYNDGNCFLMSMRDGSYSFNFYGKNSAGVTNVDTYWFGYYSDRIPNRWIQTNLTNLSEIDSGMAFTWQNRTVPAQGSITLSALIGIGEPTSPAEMNMTTSDLRAIESDGIISFTGTINSEDATKTVTVYLTVDRNTADNRIIAQNIILGVIFSYNLHVSELNLPDGAHTLEIWARDSEGALSNAGILNVTIFTPQPIVLNPNGINEIPADQNSVSFNGIGEIARRVNGDIVGLILNDIRLHPNSIVTAQKLSITRSLRLLGNSNLSAAPNEYIGLEENVQIIFDVVDDALPTFNLGNIPENVLIPIPYVFQVTIPANFSTQARTFALVSGRNFDCENWRSKVNVPMGYKNTNLNCAPRRGARFLDDNEQVLYLDVAKVEIPTQDIKTTSQDNQNPSKLIGTWIMISIVGILALVVGSS